MAETQTLDQEQARRRQRLAQYRAWYETFIHEHGAAIARTRLLRLRRRETHWHWLPL